MNVLIRDLPDEVHAALQRRAERRGQSLQQYLAAELARLAQRPALDELLDQLLDQTTHPYAGEIWDGLTMKCNCVSKRPGYVIGTGLRSSLMFVLLTCGPKHPA